MKFLYVLVALILLFCQTAKIANATGGTQFLPPEEAFALSVESIEASHVILAFTLQPKHYLYADKFHFSSDDPVTLKAAILPNAVQRQDQFSGKVKATYPESIRIKIPFADNNDTFTLKVKAQGCAEAGLCYPPFTQTIDVLTPTGMVQKISADNAYSNVSTSGNQQTTDTESEVKAIVGDESTRIGNMLSSGHYFITLISFFGFGLLLAFTPCVFPMIPILSSIIIGQGSTVTKTRALQLSTAYVIGMAVTYSLAGVAAGLSGTMLTAALQNIWVLSGFAIIFVVLSLAMFDVYQLQLPASIQSKISRSAENQKGGSIFGVSAMGALSALIVGPCIAAPLAGALLYIAKTGDALLGGTALLCLSLGMGIPLIAVGVAANSLLPSAGVWMDTVKRIFGVLLLAVAIWIISPVVSPLVVMFFIALLALFCAVFLHALDPLPNDSSTVRRMGKCMGVVLLVVGLSMLLGILGGSRNPTQPLDFLHSKSMSSPTTPEHEIAFKQITSLEHLEASITVSTQPVFLDFYADWCVSCKEMEAFTFSDNKVKAKMEAFTLLQVDVTNNTEVHKTIMKQFNIFGPPAVIMLTPENRELLRVIGFMRAKEFADALDKVTS